MTGYGYGDRLRKPAQARLSGTGNRVEYRRGDLTEWYLNGSQGLEQGFTLAHRPEINRDAQPLVIAFDMTGGLLPAKQSDEDAVLFKSSKGIVFRYAGLQAQDARGRIVPSRLEVRGHQIRLIVDDHDAQYPLVVDPTWTQQPALTAPDGASGDDFGYSVSLDGDTAAIGAYYKNNQKGAAYIFVRSGGVWSLQQELTAPDGVGATPGVPGDSFGYSVSVNGDTAVIGAYAKNTTPGLGYAGAAYVFVRSSGVWSLQQELTYSTPSADFSFGYSVSVSGDTAVIGGPSTGVIAGVAFVFVRSGGVWSLQQSFSALDAQANDLFGYSVSVSGNTAVIGAPEAIVNSNFMQGAAYVFVRSGGVWGQQQKLTASDGGPYNNFGTSVSVSGDTAAIGSPGNTVNSNTTQGAAYVFVRSAGAWSPQQELTAFATEPATPGRRSCLCLNR